MLELAKTGPVMDSRLTTGWIRNPNKNQDCRFLGKARQVDPATLQTL